MKISTVILILFILISCSSKTSIKVNVAMQPNYKEVGEIKTLAVLPFYGPYGKEFSAKIESMIMNANSSYGKTYYKLVERSEIKKVVDEISFSSSYFVNQDTAVNIGKMLGAQGILTGTVNGAAVQDNPYSEKRMKCGQYQNNVIKGPYGPITIPICIRWDPYYVNCNKRTANFSVTVKVINVEVGSLVYSSDYSENESSEACSDSGNAVKSSLELLSIVQNRVLNRIRMDILPYNVVMNIFLMEDTNGIKDSISIDKFLSGIEFAKKDRLDRSCEIWEGLLEKNSDSVSLNYNMGVCKEAFGDLLAAKEFYKKADKLLSKPDDTINAALKRINFLINKNKK